MQLQLDSPQLTSNDVLLLQAQGTATAAPIAVLKLHRTSWPDDTTDSGMSLSNVQVEAIPSAWAALRAWARTDAIAVVDTVAAAVSSSSSSSSSAAAVEQQAYRWTVELLNTALTATVGESQYAVTMTAQLAVSNGAFCNGSHCNTPKVAAAVTTSSGAAAADDDDCVVSAAITHLDAHVREQLHRATATAAAAAAAAVRPLLTEPVQRGHATVVLSTNGQRHVECAFDAVQLRLHLTDAALLLACYNSVSSSSSSSTATATSDVAAAAQQDWRVTATVETLSLQLIDDSSIHFERCAEQQLISISAAALALEYSLESLSVQLQKLHITDHLQPHSSTFSTLLAINTAVNSVSQQHDAAAAAAAVLCGVVYKAATPQRSAEITVALPAVAVNWNPSTIAALWQLHSALQLCSAAAQQHLLTIVLGSSAVNVKAAMRDAVHEFLLLEAELNNSSNNSSSSSTNAADAMKHAAAASVTAATAVSAHRDTVGGLRVSMTAGALCVHLNKESADRRLLTLHTSDSELNFSSSKDSSSSSTATALSATFTGFTVTDACADNFLYTQLIGPRSDSSSSDSGSSSSACSLSVNYSSSDTAAALLRVATGSGVQLVYIQQLWLEVVDYAFQGILASAVWGTAVTSDGFTPVTRLPTASTATTAAAAVGSTPAASDDHGLKIEVEVLAPLIVLPSSYTAQHLSIAADAIKFATWTQVSFCMVCCVAKHCNAATTCALTLVRNELTCAATVSDI
jgi:hypothetical protein